MDENLKHPEKSNNDQGQPEDGQKEIEKGKEELEPTQGLGGERDKIRYQIFADEIRSIKSQQWSIAYYSLLVQAALIGFLQLIQSFNECTLLVILIVVVLCSAAVAVAGFLVIHCYHDSMTDYRREMHEILDGKGPDDNDKKEYNKMDKIFKWLFGIVFVAGAMAVIVFGISLFCAHGK